MKRLLISASLILIGIIFISIQLYRYSVDSSLSDWHSQTEGFIKANLEQKHNGKPILLFFYTDWCSNCRALREKVLTSSEVKKFLSHTIPVKINPETGRTENELSNEFGVMGYPTLILISPSQSIVEVHPR